MEKYLVTGGAGFIGSHIVEHLVREGQFVRVLDNFDTGSRENLAGMDAEIVEGSIEDEKLLARAMKDIDYVLHEAARGSVPRSIEDPIGTHNNNITGTLKVLKAAVDNKVKRVVCASSSSVYGETPVLPKEESMFPTPMSPYAASKLAGEYYCGVFHHVYGLETVSLRYFNIYGPRQNPNIQYAAVIPIFISNMLKGKQCVIYGDGEQTRDFTFVEDCVRANMLACKADGVAGGVFNIGCERQTSVNELYRLVQELLGNKTPPLYKPPMKGDVKHSFARIERARKSLRFEPRLSLKEGLKQTVEWYKTKLQQS